MYMYKINYIYIYYIYVHLSHGVTSSLCADSGAAIQGYKVHLDLPKDVTEAGFRFRCRPSQRGKPEKSAAIAQVTDLNGMT
jgi:hypothetical protein